MNLLVVGAAIGTCLGTWFIWDASGDFGAMGYEMMGKRRELLLRAHMWAALRGTVLAVVFLVGSGFMLGRA